MSIFVWRAVSSQHFSRAWHRAWGMGVREEWGPQRDGRTEDRTPAPSCRVRAKLGLERQGQPRPAVAAHKLVVPGGLLGVGA